MMTDLFIRLSVLPQLAQAALVVLAGFLVFLAFYWGWWWPGYRRELKLGYALKSAQLAASQRANSQ